MKGLLLPTGNVTFRSWTRGATSPAMTSLIRGLRLASISLAIAACSGAGVTATPTSTPVGSSPPVSVTAAPPSAATTSPSTPPSTSAPTPHAFESARHGYRVEVPAGWAVFEYDGSWTSLSQFAPGGEIPGEDAVATADFSSFLVMNSMPIPAGMSDAAWLAEFEALVSAGLPSDCPGTTRSGTFAGEPATIVEQACSDATIVGRSLVHGDRGYYFTTKYPQPGAATKALVDQLAASIEFTE